MPRCGTACDISVLQYRMRSSFCFHSRKGSSPASRIIGSNGICRSAVRALQFIVDERIVKPGVGGVARGRREIHAVRPRPVNRAQAHRTGLATGVDFAAGQLKRAQRAAGFADRGHLGVRRGIIRRVTEFAPVAMTWPSFTTIAPNGPPRPERTFSTARRIASLHKGVDPSAYLLSRTNHSIKLYRKSARPDGFGFRLLAYIVLVRMNLTSLFGLLGGLLVLAFAANRLFRWTRIPDVVVLMATGVLIGPVSAGPAPTSSKTSRTRSGRSR